MSPDDEEPGGLGSVVGYLVLLSFILLLVCAFVLHGGI